MPSDMTKHENIAKALKARHSELTNRVRQNRGERKKIAAGEKVSMSR